MNNQTISNNQYYHDENKPSSAKQATLFLFQSLTCIASISFWVCKNYARALVRDRLLHKLYVSVVLLWQRIEHTTSLFSENCPCSARLSGAVHFTSNLDRIPLSLRLVEFTSLARLKSVILILRSS